MDSEKGESKMINNQVNERINGIAIQITDLKEMVEELKAEIQKIASILTEKSSLLKQMDSLAINRLDNQDSNEKTKGSLKKIDSIGFLDLPKHLQETYRALLKTGKESTAVDIANQTSRQRPVESDYLNQLVRMNYVRKFRKGKKVYFSLE